jgi:hypothetical protein
MRKITRTKSIYRTRHTASISPLMAVLIIVIAAVLIFVGWSISGPLIKFFSGQLTTTSSGTPPISSASAAPASSQVKSSSEVAASDSIHGIFLPKNYIGDLSGLGNVITGAKNAGVNLVVLDLKAEDGLLNYSSKVDSAVKNHLVAANAPDAALAAAKIKDAGLLPAARITCFQDYAAPAAMKNMAVLYSKNHGTRWKDALNHLWLNPYNNDAQQYIIDIAKEAVSDGFKYIVLDGVIFPSSGNPASFAWFTDSNVSKEEQLRAFVANATKQINAAGGKVIIHMPGMASIGQAAALTGQDQNIFGYTADYISPDLSPSEFGAKAVQIEGKTIISPDLTPAATVSAAAQYIATLADKTKIKSSVPFIQAYTNTSLGSGFYKNYTDDDINGEVTSLKDNGFTSYILYSPTGSYNFTGLKIK